jgi:2-dehydro-3-deoxyglucarate aldolase/4-hydroxy-2-oxoheptanedioate aldolase
MPRVFKTLLEQGRLIHVLAVGRMPHPVMIDLLGLAGGYEGLWLDQEHAGLTTEQVVMLNMAARANGLGCFVRMPFSHYSLASQNLESGVDGVMAARIGSLAEAEEFVRWVKFAPQGLRGLNTSGADGHYTGRSAAQLAEAANRDHLVAVQIETLGSLADADKIAALEAVDLLFVGPADLSQELGVFGQPSHPKVWEAVDQVAAACKKHGKHWGTVAFDPVHADKCMEKGCRMLTFGSDVSAARLGLAAIKQTFAAHFRG